MSYYQNCINGSGILDSLELKAKLQSDFSADCLIALAVYTSGVSCFNWEGVLEPPMNAKAEDSIDFEHLLELRLFNEKKEFHALRGAMGKPFSWRVVTDDESLDDFGSSTIDESQYLDIDKKHSNPLAGEYCAIGGGCYSLPVANAEKLLVRNYIDFDEENIAKVIDFRLVKIVKAGE